jgi:hypothetical protein
VSSSYFSFRRSRPDTHVCVCVYIYIYTAKGQGGEQALTIMEGIPGLDLILITVPFFYSNFLAFFAPLPNPGRTQWELTACFGASSSNNNNNTTTTTTTSTTTATTKKEKKIDMMSASDLSVLVREYISIRFYLCCIVYIKGIFSRIVSFSSSSSS